MGSLSERNSSDPLYADGFEGKSLVSKSWLCQKISYFPLLPWGVSQVNFSTCIRGQHTHSLDFKGPLRT